MILFYLENRFRFNLSRWAVFISCLVSLLGCVKANKSATDLIMTDEDSHEVSQKRSRIPGKSGQKHQSSNSAIKDGDKVKLNLYAMSKCPFFAKLISTIAPIIQNMGDYIELKIDYVGKIHDDDLQSIHGPKEISGDILQLCAHKYGTIRQWIEFIECQYKNIDSIPKGWEECVAKSEISLIKMESCYTSSQGKNLLRSSISKVNKNNITASPVISINGKSYNKKHSEVSIARAICNEFASPKPKACSDYPQLTEISIVIVNDKRCASLDCNSDYTGRFVEYNFDLAKVKQLDYSDKEGAELFKKSGIRYLPIVVFNSEIKKEKDVYFRLRDYLIEIEGGRFAYPLGRTWDPTMEVCDDGLDNNEDGKVDCEDAYCQYKQICRTEKKREIKLFIMSYCPYCTDALGIMKDVLKNFKNNRKHIDFKIEFVGQEHNNELYSLHGPPEIEEDLRQICVQKHYPNKYKFMEYLWCRNQAYEKNKGNETDDAWKDCTINGIKSSVVRKCAEGKEGRELLAISFQLAKNLGIHGSPRWLLNNRYKAGVVSAEDLIDLFCRKNKETKGCDN
ncbi:MAG: hypothetical protein GY847_26690 [Proteobacteria bacterium]|nr:hypothetical protein [Pseudomonadota bacterium]